MNLCNVPTEWTDLHFSLSISILLDISARTPFLPDYANVLMILLVIA